MQRKEINMLSAQTKTYIKRIATPLVGVALLISSINPVLATTAQVCNPSVDCSIGEFLYDDNYVPITSSATCLLNSKYPDGSAYITDQSLTSTSDGWYGHTFTTPTTEGYYRSEICCDHDSDHFCIDKSFDVKEESTGTSPSASDIAAAVWGYSSRTLTGFNNIVADVWGYASRTITGGTTTTTVTSDDLAAIKKTTSETRLLVEELVNKPIIENSLEEVKDIDLSERIKQSKTITNELYINLMYLTTTISKTNTNWNNLSDREILDNLNEAKNIIGDESDSSSTDSFFGRINFLKDTWGLKESDDLREEMNAVKSSLGFVQTGITSYGKSASLQKEVSGVSVYLGSSENILVLLNKKIKEIESLASAIDTNLAETNNILSSWSFDSYLGIKASIDTLIRNVFAINKVPKGQLVIESAYTDVTGEKMLRNKVLGIRALLFANKKLLIGGEKIAFAANWLEEGSIVIKTLITNPSYLISQDVPLVYYLPNELKMEDIIETDAGIEVKYDTEKDQLFVEGNFTLKPGQTKTIRVRVNDVWTLDISEIDSLNNQAEELTKSLEKTSFFAQGITLKGDINVSLSKAKELAKNVITPENKIKSYREAQLEILTAKENIERLKDLVSQASSSGSILGFIGGSQAIGVWGIVIAIATGFVFMTIYMRKLLGKDTAKENVKVTKNISNFDKIAVILVVVTILGLASSIVVKKMVLPQLHAMSSQEVLGETTVDYKTLKIVELVSIDGVVNIYQNETGDAVLEIVDSGKGAIEVLRGETRAKVIYDQKEAWVDILNVLISQ